MSKSLLIGILSSLVFLLFFCGIYRHDVPRERVVALASEPQFRCVGKVWNGEHMAGSCVLVGESTVLSAAHVFLKYGAGKAVYDEPQNFSMEFDRRYHVARMTAHPAFLDTYHAAHEGDLILIELTEEVPGITPAVLNTRFDELHSRVVGVGYGVTGRADKPDSVGLSTVKTAGENLIDTIIGAPLDGQATILRCDFDHPTIAALSKMGGAVPLPMEYVCGGGDSGGGLFSNRHGRWELVGICSQHEDVLEEMMVTGYYGGVMGWTRVAAYQRWIRMQRD